MRTAVVSDLHLGALAKSDLLGDAGVRESLLREIEGVDQLVLLGDVLELREQPLANVLDAARPFFDDLGEAVGDARVVVVAGNHDHQLAGTLFERRAMRGVSKPLEAENFAPPGSTGPLASLARRMPRAETVLAYPGLWLRPDVYAMHGHYLDYHATVPTFERLAIGLTARLAGRHTTHPELVDDYEAALAPLYSFLYQLAQGAKPGHDVGGGRMSMKIWRRLNAPNGRFDLGAEAIRRLLIPGGVALANRFGLGPVRSKLTGAEIARAGIAGMSEVMRRLGIEADHVLFGHTHRQGPLPGEESEWTLPQGTRLLNTGSWIFEPNVVGPADRGSPYWPGVVVFVEESGPPQVRRLLDSLPTPRLDAAAEAQIAE